MQGFIAHIRKFVSLSDEEVEVLMEYVSAREVKKKEVVMKEGEVCKEMMFVEKGCMRMFFINEKGAEQTVYFGLENWWLADFMSYDRQQPSQHCIQSVEASELWMVRHDKYDALVKALPQMERYFRIIFQKAYAAAQMRVKFYYDQSKEETYREFARMFPEFIQRIPQYMLASYLGLTPEYLSELRKKR